MSAHEQPRPTSLVARVGRVLERYRLPIQLAIDLAAWAAGLYFAVPHASVLVKAPTDFSNTVLQVHKNIMAA